MFFTFHNQCLEELSFNARTQRIKRGTPLTIVVVMCLPPPPSKTKNPTGYVKNNSTPVPSTKEILAAIPKRCFEKSTARSLTYASVSVALTVGVALLARAFIPLELWALPVWIAYAFIEGTIATGCWVIAHECGHGGAHSFPRIFSDAPHAPFVGGVPRCYVQAYK